MRDAITLLDKCLSYSSELTVDNVVKALGVADYETMFRLVDALDLNDIQNTVSIINTIYNSGIDLKLFIKTFFEFIQC
jgi:DNA polymerase-3 subunit gamma/tau